jgi:hypothetical protein
MGHPRRRPLTVRLEATELDDRQHLEVTPAIADRVDEATLSYDGMLALIAAIRATTARYLAQGFTLDELDAFAHDPEPCGRRWLAKHRHTDAGDPGRTR